MGNDPVEKAVKNNQRKNSKNISEERLYKFRS